jgi:TIGR00255 family protein
MTGFGRGVASSPTKKITVELKSVNSKQLDLSMRVPSYFRELEITMRADLARRLQRGKVEMVVNVENLVPEAPSAINVDVLRQYKQQIIQAVETLDIPVPSDWCSVLLRLPEALKTDVRQVDDADEQAFRQACDEAADALTRFRQGEGERLFGFFLEKIDNISRLLGEVDPFESERVQKIRERLEQQLSKLDSVEYDRGRLEQELIFYIEKLDVTEEKTRLRSHLNYFLDILRLPADSGQGKQLGFIAQEIGREINTLGSKSNNADMQKLVVKMKDELEQIKEQVLNVL